MENRQLMNRKTWLLASTLGVALLVHSAFAESVSTGQSKDQVLWRDLMQKVHAETLKRQAAHEQQVHNAGIFSASEKSNFLSV